MGDNEPIKGQPLLLHVRHDQDREDDHQQPLLFFLSKCTDFFLQYYKGHFWNFNFFLLQKAMGSEGRDGKARKKK